MSEQMLELNLVQALQPQLFPSPCFVTDVEKLRQNAAILDKVQQRTGAKILLALKGFAQWGLFSELSRTFHGPLYGCCASSPDEARLAREEFQGEVHAFAAAYSQEDVQTLLPLVDHLVFNSCQQLQAFHPMVQAHNLALQPGGRRIECGLRLNPEHSEGAVDIYNPCSSGSRLGIRARHFQPELLPLVSGLHFHTLCEQGADALERTLDAVLRQFGQYLPQLRWLNFGGGHHITKPGYDLDLLCACIRKVMDMGLQVYLEPGEAVALNAGYLVSTVLDVVQADMPIAILDTSASCHMPDVLEMPYRPHVLSSAHPGQKAYTCRLAGKSCLAGDVIGEYSFDAPLQVGQKLVFTDMAIYSMVKMTTFNGLRLPSIATFDPKAKENRKVVRSFGYEDFKERLS